MSTVTEQILKTIVAHYAPKQVFLFGSRARDDASPYSDYDLLVVLDENQPRPSWRDRAALRRKLGVPSDVIPYPADKFERYHDVVGSLPWTVLHEGKQLYALGCALSR